MQLIYFTKFLKGRGTEEIGEIARGLGFDGLDVAVRAGQCVNPDNVRTALAPALKVWASFGLSAPLVTLEWGWVDPELPALRDVYAACGEAGIPFIKLGYWGWQPSQRYWDGVDAIRRALEGFQRLGEQHGVCTLVHTHSGGCYGCNASGVMHLVKGFEPRRVAVYLDPAHIALEGEPLPMALDIVREYLRMVGVKNVRYLPAQGGGWTRECCLLSEGLVDWAETIRLLREAGCDCPLSVHGEYSVPEDWETIGPRVAQDMAFIAPLARDNSPRRTRRAQQESK